MAIVFNCPHCLFAYRLKDEFGGKQAKCKNPDCRQLITIPRAITIEENGPAMSEAEAEAAAIAALNEESLVKQQATAPAEQMIPVTCRFCDHKWSEPISKAGKNVLCPNPECRQRIKVEEPKKEDAADWRHQKTKLPEAARQNQPKLEDVQDAASAKIVSAEALRKADATGEEYEPRTLKQKIMIGLTIFGLVGSLAFGIWYVLTRRTAIHEEQLMADARKELAETRKEWGSTNDKKDPKFEWAVSEGPLFSAVLHLAAAEYALRFEDAKKTKEANGLFGKEVSSELRGLQGPERDAVVAEVIFEVLSFAGTDQQVKDQVRYAWTPESQSGRIIRMNEQMHTIHGELRTTLGMLMPADFEFKLSVVRRLTRELTKRGHSDIAADLIPQAVFSGPQKSEARAIIALEIHRTDSASPLPRAIAEDLKRQFASANPPVPVPASASVLFAVLNVDNAAMPKILPQGEIGGSERFAHTALLLLEKKNEEALAMAQRPPVRLIEHQLKALALCAEWMPDPTAALEAAKALSSKARKLPWPHLLRLAQIAAENGKHDLAKTFADAISDAGVSAWAMGEAVHIRTLASPGEKASEGWIELPESPRDLKVGHAWGRLWIARQNAKLSHNRDAEKNATSTWPPPIHPFGLAGIALGLQDR